MPRLCNLLLAGTACLAACRFDPSGLPADDDADAAPGTPDALVVDADPAAPDAEPDVIDAPPACEWPQPPLHFDPCDLPAGGVLNLALLGRYVYDTDTGMLTDPAMLTTMPPSVIVDQGVQDARVLVADSFSLGATSVLRVKGSLPLIIASDSTIVINGNLSANSVDPNLVLDDPDGPGANPAICADDAPTEGAPAAGTADNQGGGGGGGGAFQGDGGDGGDGTGAAKGAKGTKVDPPAELRGGCAGAAGGAGNGVSGGTAGSGGGAVELAARTSITVSGLVQAGGARGGRGLQGVGVTPAGGAGAGGAGSGGMIFIDTTTLTLGAASILAANGGGGGEGGDDNQDGALNAEDGQASAMAASKGSGGADKGGDGGDGGTTGNGANAQNRESGGGGGGGTGYIIFHTVTTNKPGSAVVSPAEDTQ
jgi:hypothetical protein